jgi:hypothetical protein
VPVSFRRSRSCHCASITAVGGVKWCGVYDASALYRQGSLVTRSGSLWICRRDSRGSTPGVAGGPWVLVVKNGGHAHGDAP